jgi:uncharacterized cupredoxin-like copper-binding protein
MQSEMQAQPRPATPRTSPTRPALVSWGAVALYKTAELVRGGFDLRGLLATVALVAVAGGVAAVVFGVLVRRALDAPTRTAAARGAALGGLGVVLNAAFWSGLPIVLGSAAILLGSRERRRAGEADGGRLPVIAVALGVAAIAGSVALVIWEEEATSNHAGDTVRVDATEFAYVMPEVIAGGAVTFEFVNAGRDLHEFALVRLDDGRGVEDILAAFDTAQEPDWWDAASLPGVPLLSPGHEVRVTASLDSQGTYAFFCPLPTADFTPHMALGMVRTFEVAAARDRPVPAPDVVITATDEGFEVPLIPAGRVTVELRNTGRRPHEFSLTAYHAGMTSAAVEAWFESGQPDPAPASFLGGIQAIAPGTSVFLQLQLQPGVAYTLEDFAAGFEWSFTPR